MIITTEDEENVRSGLNFKTKHKLNGIVASWKKNHGKKIRRILEACQGLGEGTKIYKDFAPVLAFEKKSDTYNKMIKKMKKELGEQLLVEREYINKFESISESFGEEFPVIVPDRPVNSTSEEAMGALIEKEIKFDIIDIDVYGSPQTENFFPRIFELVRSDSILFVTVGDVQRREPRVEIMEDYDIFCEGFDFQEDIFQQDCALFVGAWLVNKGLRHDIGLKPVFMHDYYFQGEGVHRLCFFVETGLGLSEKSKLVKETLQEDSTLNEDKINCESTIKIDRENVTKNIQDSPNLTSLRLNEDSDQILDGDKEKEVKKIITDRLEFLSKRK